MKKLFILLLFFFFSTQGFTATCSDGSEPTRSVSSDGSYYVYKCSNTSTNSSSSSSSSSSNIPANAIIWGATFACKSGYYRNKSKTACLKVPKNGTKVSISNFKCNLGYQKSDLKTRCIKSSSTKITTTSSDYVSSLPKCTGSIWDNCFGTYKWDDGTGDIYVGEWNDDELGGIGILTYGEGNDGYAGDKYVGCT